MPNLDIRIPLYRLVLISTNQNLAEIIIHTKFTANGYFFRF
jgi:hypothetical protein